MQRTIAFLSLLAAGAAAHAAPVHVIQSAQIDRPALNVAARETVTLLANFTLPGTASVRVLDRDGYVVRSLANVQPVHAGAMSFGWDGRDDAGQFVADEAYSFRIDWRGASGSDTYFPADQPQPMLAINARSYDRRTATLSFTLTKPSRVHIQAGTAILDPQTKQLIGPVMKTIVNREPRVGGAIAQHWNGYDESGTIYIPDLENVVVAIAATALPENSVITFGNRTRRFVETLNRRGASLLLPRAHHPHHAGLRTEDDISPALRIQPLNARWSANERCWIIKGQGRLQLRLSVEGPTAPAFRGHPATIQLFIDGCRIGDASRKKIDIITVHFSTKHGTHSISINWTSDWGPVAANTIQVRRVGTQTVAAGGVP